MLANSNFLTALEHNAVSPPNWPTDVHIRRPGLSFKGKSHGTVQRGRPDSANGSLQWFYVECAYVSRVVVWRHCGVFQVYGLLKNLEIGLSSIGKLYVVCALLRNALTCLYGNSTSSFLELDPPTLEEYFFWAILDHLSTNCWRKI